MVSSFILSHIQGWTGGFLSDTCLIEQEQEAAGQYGEPLNIWVTVAADVPCRIITAGETTQTEAMPVGDGEAITEEYRLVCPAGTALATGQRVTVAGVVYQVAALLTARTDETDVQAVITRYR